MSSTTKEKTLSIEFTRDELDVLEASIHSRIGDLEGRRDTGDDADRFWTLRIDAAIRVGDKIGEARGKARV